MFVRKYEYFPFLLTYTCPVTRANRHKGFTCFIDAFDFKIRLYRENINTLEWEKILISVMNRNKVEK
jgi:hypothetical protein